MDLEFFLGWNGVRNVVVLGGGEGIFNNLLNLVRWIFWDFCMRFIKLLMRVIFCEIKFLEYIFDIGLIFIVILCIKSEFFG